MSTLKKRGSMWFIVDRTYNEKADAYLTVFIAAGTNIEQASFKKEVYDLRRALGKED